MKTSPRIDEAWQRLRQELTVYLGADADMVFLLVQGRYATVGQTFSELLALSVPPGCDIRTVDLSQSDAQDALGEADGVTLAVGLAGLEEGERRALLGALNRRRGLLDQRKIKLVLWVEPELLPEIYTHAADLLEWRTRLIELPLHPVALPDATSWLRWPVAIDFAPLFQAAIADGVEVARRRVIGVIEDAVAAAQAVQVIEPAQRKAATLVARALAFGMLALIRDHRHHFVVMRSQSASHGEMGGLAVDLTLEIDFFERPDALPALAVLRPLLAEWMRLHGRRDDPHGVYEQPTRARTIAARLGPYYAEALAREYRQRHADYAAIWDAIQSPLTGIEQRARDWRAYHAKLIRLPDQPLFADTFSLRQVYQPLRAWWLDRDEADETDPDEPEGRGRPRDEDEGTRQVVAVTPTLHEWLDAERPDDAIRVATGGPGAGKSSLARMIAADCAAVATARVGQPATLTRAYRVMLIELHHFDLRADLREAIHAYGRDLCGLRDDPFAHLDGDPLLLIFDGLDELAIRGNAGRQTVVDLVAQVEQLLERLNHTAPRVRALLLGREVVVASLEHLCRRRQRLLHLLPYRIPADESVLLSGDSGFINHDQRDAWWRAYGEQVGEPLAGLPSELSVGRIDELTAEPLLNYLIAITRAARPGLFAQEGASLTDVYDDLVRQVYQRTHARAATNAPDKTHALPVAREVSEEEFGRFLQTIAVAAWHGDGRVATSDQIRARLPKRLLDKLDALSDAAQDGISRLIAAFYFRPLRGPNAVSAFEFTHQSFGEYLLATHIVRFLGRMHDQRAAWDHDDESGWSPRTCLSEWVKLFGPAAIEPHLADFIADALRRMATDRVAAYQALLGDLISRVLVSDFPVDAMPRSPDLGDLLAHSRNAGEALLVCAASCARLSQKTTAIRTPEPTALGRWIRRLQGQRAGSENTMALRHLEHVEFGNSDLQMSDLFGANLEGARLFWANLEGANLEGANLSWANLEEANLEGANLEGANLEEANLEGARLFWANLEGANLEGANLEGAKLFGANLEGANLEGANLEGAKLSWANLEEANLEGANLEGANLEEANLERANLKGARYDADTRWPDGWDPASSAARLIQHSDGE